MPLLSSICLFDKGKSNLNQKIIELQKLVEADPCPDYVKIQKSKGWNKKSSPNNTAADKEESVTYEEQFVGSALKSIKLHAKAKVLIFRMIEDYKATN